MKVFKFGGASVKDAQSVKNVAEVLKTTGYQNTFMVVSAMGKSTNALEEVLEKYIAEDNYVTTIAEIQGFHHEIVNELFDKGAEQLNKDIELFFADLVGFLRRNKSPNYNYVYDEVVSCGEMISTKIISAYLNHIGIENQWLDVRDYIKTDSTYREGKVDWETTQKNIEKLSKDKFYITQGFIGSDKNRFTVTLGREGSDYSAAIFAYCLDAESMTIWKDVPGVLNGDPRYFEDTVLLNHISYEEAIELAYYGASVIHPKTLQPLQRKDIPFFVKSFIEPTGAGTSVKKGQPLEPHMPCFILKKNQILLSLRTKDFSFITEQNLAYIFKEISKQDIKVNISQNSAISLSLCLEDKFMNFKNLVEVLEENYDLDYYIGASLYTVRHFDEASNQKVSEAKEILLRQIVKETLQIVTK